MASNGFRGGLRRAASVALVGGALWHLLEALELRRRFGVIPPLSSPADDNAGAGDNTVVAVAVGGVTVDERTRAGAVRTMGESGIEVLDLVPGDLPVEAALRFLRRVNPTRLREDIFLAPGGAHEAVLLSPSVAGRVGPPAGPARDRGVIVRLSR